MALHDFAAMTSVGMRRKHNQDNMLVIKKASLIAVADGMGGLRDGEVASATAMSVVKSAQTPLIQLAQTVDSGTGSDGRIQLARTLDVLAHLASEKIQEVTGGTQSGTTMVAGMVANDHFLITHVGDSRAYLFRSGTLRCLTEDHSVAASQLRAGTISQEEHDNSPYQHMLYQALGTAGSVDPDILDVKLADGDILLLCSDGLTGPVKEPELLALLSDNTDLKKTASKLIDTANENGGPDNITVVLARASAANSAETVDSYEAALRKSGALDGLTDNQFLVLSLYLDTIIVPEGDTIDTNRGLYILLEGSVTSAGHDIVPSQCFGLKGFCGKHTSDNDVMSNPDNDKTRPKQRATANSDVVAALLRPSAFLSLHTRRPSLAVPIMQGLLQEMSKRYDGP
jgi:serine/threonine protein phosphatase PrpC